MPNLKNKLKSLSYMDKVPTLSDNFIVMIHFINNFIVMIHFINVTNNLI